MPFVRIDMIEAEYLDEQRLAMGEVVYEALRSVGALEDDRFQVFCGHRDGNLAFDRNYLGIERTHGFVAIQITMNDGRSPEQKKALFAAIAEGFHKRAGTRPEDVFINLIEVPKENWSFGKGEAQYADCG